MAGSAVTPTPPGDHGQIGRVRFGPEIFRIQRYGGVSRYILELHQELLHQGIDSRVVAGLHRSAMTAGLPGVAGWDIDRVRPPLLRQALSRVADERLAWWERRQLGPRDVWHPSYFSDIPPGRSAVAVTVYDMVHERFPEEMSRRDRTLGLKASACRAADVIFCISADTAADLEQRFGIHQDRLVVTHLGVRPVDPARQQPPPFGERPFVVFVGDRAPLYKNWRMLLDALALGPSDLAALCIGAPPSRSELQEVERRGLSGRVRFEHGSDAQLAGRFREAAGLVYPSRYEGFGLPPLEALAQGCPVVATAVGAIPETVGGLAMLVDPSVAGLVSGLEALVAGDPAIDRQRELGPAHAARFTWHSTAVRTLDGYARALS